MSEARWKSEFGWYRVCCEPIKGTAAEKRGNMKIRIMAWSGGNAVAIACQRLDLHPKNWAFSTDLLARTGRERDGIRDNTSK